MSVLREIRAPAAARDYTAKEMSMSETYEVGELVQVREASCGPWEDATIASIGGSFNAYIRGRTVGGRDWCRRDDDDRRIRKHPVRPAAVPPIDWKVGDECEVAVMRAAEGVGFARSAAPAELAAATWLPAKVRDASSWLAIDFTSGEFAGWSMGVQGQLCIRRPAGQRVPIPTALADPLDAVIDGLTLRYLLKCDRLNRQENETSTFSPAQRAAVSAHWSAELRAKVTAAKERARCTVSYCEEED